MSAPPPPSDGFDGFSSPPFTSRPMFDSDDGPGSPTNPWDKLQPGDSFDDQGQGLHHEVEPEQQPWTVERLATTTRRGVMWTTRHRWQNTSFSLIRREQILSTLGFFGIVAIVAYGWFTGPLRDLPGYFLHRPDDGRPAGPDIRSADDDDPEIDDDGSTPAAVEPAGATPTSIDEEEAEAAETVSRRAPARSAGRKLPTIRTTLAPAPIQTGGDPINPLRPETTVTIDPLETSTTAESSTTSEAEASTSSLTTTRATSTTRITIPTSPPTRPTTTATSAPSTATSAPSTATSAPTTATTATTVTSTTATTTASTTASTTSETTEPPTTPSTTPPATEPEDTTPPPTEPASDPGSLPEIS